MQVSTIATAISLLIGLPLGTWLALGNFSGRSIVLSIVNTGMALPPVVVGLAVAMMLWRSGPLGDLKLIYTPAAIVIAQTIIAAPVVTGLTAAALAALDPRLEQQLFGLGAVAHANGLVPVAGGALPLAGRADGRVWGRHLRSGRLDDGGRQHPWTNPRAYNLDRHGDGSGGIPAGDRSFGAVAPDHLFDQPGPDLDPAKGTQDGKPVRSSKVNMIQIRDLVINRNGHSVLQVDSLDIQRGETLTVVGPNGSGKSTLLLALARLLKPSRGEIHYDGKSLKQLNELEYRRKISFVFQAPLLDGYDRGTKCCPGIEVPRHKP